MENAPCHVIYVDRAISQDRHVRVDARSAKGDTTPWESAHIAENVGLLLDVFGEVHLCSTGGACLTQWLNLQDTSMMDLKPTIILIDTPYQGKLTDRSRARSPSPNSPPEEDTENHEEELYGLALLQRITSESYLRSLSKLVLAIPLVNFPRPDSPIPSDSSSDMREEIAHAKLHPSSSMDRRVANRRMLKKCLDLGATDVMASPMNGKCITNLEVHAYRAHREAARDQKALMEVRRGRKRSWVGISEEKPFAYLREAMVSNLMNGICRIENENEEGLTNVRIWVPSEKQAEITEAVGKWHFCAHSFTDDELIFAAAVMFNHALAMPELEAWRLPTDQLNGFLVACRAAYNVFVPYHNFRHVVDVLQATFHFLVRIGALPPYPSASGPPVDVSTKSPISALLNPFEALTMLITAIGHDVGHPGVNNGFLVTLNAPLAQLYNDRSVLESFHCAAYSQILRRHWPAAFADHKLRNLMISSILATDMGLHFDYMKRLADLQDKLRRANSTDGWDARMIDEQKALACALLIKCADISNVARRHDTALKWMHTLADEFSRQAVMETELGIPSSLMAPPKKDMLSLGRNQMGFMNLFAIPLFQGVADILPAMQYCVDELESNRGLFENTVAKETEKSKAPQQPQLQDDNISPKSRSFPPGQEPPTESSPVLPDLSPPPGLVEHSVSEKDRTTGSDVNLAVKPVDRPKSSPAGRGGVEATFDGVTEFGRRDSASTNTEDKMQGPTKQRCSETTEGSSAPYTGDWASQATSATTGKMPLSPSTQGTSIVSRDSLERPTSSVPATTITAPEHPQPAVPELTKSLPPLRPHRSHQSSLEQSRHLSLNWGHNNGAPNGMASKGALHPTDAEQQNGRTLKKKSSRFRINPLPFIRRHLSSSPPLHAADTAG